MNESRRLNVDVDVDVDVDVKSKWLGHLRETLSKHQRRVDEVTDLCREQIGTETDWEVRELPSVVAICVGRG